MGSLDPRLPPTNDKKLPANRYPGTNDPKTYRGLTKSYSTSSMRMT